MKSLNFLFPLQSGSLPWEKDVEMCTLNEEISKYDELYLKRAFAKKGLDISYDSTEGQYVILNSDPTKSGLDAAFKGLVELVVFAKDKEIANMGEPMYHRVGWQRRILPPDCQYSVSLECFPERLVREPLPLKLFGEHSVPVPREEFELLKYHFPDDWWKEVKPLNC